MTLTCKNANSIYSTHVTLWINTTFILVKREGTFADDYIDRNGNIKINLHFGFLKFILLCDFTQKLCDLC